MNGASLYLQALGPAFTALAPVLQRLHGSGARRNVQGTLRVRVGSHPLARAFLWLGRLPLAQHTAAACHLRLSFDEDENGERWDRRIGPHRIISVQKPVSSRVANQVSPTTAAAGEIIERFGLLTLDLCLRVKRKNLWVRSRAARFGGILLPAWLAIRVVAYERAVDENSFCVDVRVSSPLIGRLLEYRGRLRLDGP
jgi:hypothetical protein